MVDLKFFPYPAFKESQKVAYEKLKTSLENQMHFLLHLPTGGGKTAVALSLSLQTAQEKGLKAIYLTSRHEQHRKPIEEFLKIRQKCGLNFYVSSFKSKQVMCPQLKGEEIRDFYEMCKLAKKNKTCAYHVNLSDFDLVLKVIKKIKSEISNPEKLEEKYKFDLTELIYDYSKKSKLCPYEISGFLAEDSILIIGDFYHVFGHHQAEFLKRVGKKLKEIILIIDEGDQLPDRIRGHFSEHLTTFMINASIAQANRFKQNLTQAQIEFWEDYLNRLGDLKTAFEEFCISNLKGKEAKVEKEQFNEILLKYFNLEETIKVFFDAEEIIRNSGKRAYRIAEFLADWNEDKPSYARILHINMGNFVLDHLCLDPAEVASQIINKTYATILMSGSLTPVEAYADFLGFDRTRTEMLELPRSKEDFPIENSLVAFDISVTTWIKRREAQIERIAEHVEGIINNTPGSAIVYFPSYELRDRIAKIMKLKKLTLLEKPEMTQAERSDAIKALCKEAVFLGVLSGKFSRGIDLPGVLKAIIVVGVPVHPPDLFSKLLEEYYSDKFGSKDIGALYAWRIPAINAAIQAAGRLIRTKDDRGVIAFLDGRYLFVRDYYKILPVEYRDYKKVVRDPIPFVRKFWNYQ